MAAPFRLLFGLPKILEFFATTGIVLKGIQKKIMAVKRNLDQVGRIAQMTFVELTKYKRHQQKYNERRREATERLRKHLTTVWKALENGESVNGYTTKETWAKHFFNPTASHPERWIQKIVANKPRAKSVRPVTNLKAGMKVSIGGKEFTLTDAMIGTLAAMVPKKEEQPAPTEKRDFAKERREKKRAVIEHAAQKNLKTHQMQPNDRRTWCGKTPGLTLKKDAPMSDEPTCKQCQLGKGMDKLRREYAPVLHPAAKALAAVVDGAVVSTEVCPEPADQKQ